MTRTGAGNRLPSPFLRWIDDPMIHLAPRTPIDLYGQGLGTPVPVGYLVHQHSDSSHLVGYNPAPESLHDQPTTPLHVYRPRLGLLAGRKSRWRPALLGNSFGLSLSRRRFENRRNPYRLIYKYSTRDIEQSWRMRIGWSVSWASGSWNSEFHDLDPPRRAPLSPPRG